MFKSRIIASKNLNEIVKELRALKIKVGPPQEHNPAVIEYFSNSMKLEAFSKERYTANSGKGKKFFEKSTIFAYDESINKYSALQCKLFTTTHAIVLPTDKTYEAMILLSIHAYTFAERFGKNADIISIVGPGEDLDSKANEDRVHERNKFIWENVSDNSIMLIDGPLIGGNISSYNLELSNKLLAKNVIPIFIVKNSNSRLVVESSVTLSKEYNNDLHWAVENLQEGERSELFKYCDKQGNKSKVFFYLKFYGTHIVRVEFSVDTFSTINKHLNDYVDLIYYLIVSHGDKNPQARPIAIAEMYARDAMKLIDLYKGNILKDLGVLPTLNQERFGWGD